MPARVWILWVFLLLRGAFYSSLLPLWEGWDEYAHLAWIQHWIDHTTLPSASDGISREIDESMRQAPLPRELRWLGPPYLTHEQWWALPQAERAQRRVALAAIPPAWAHQPAGRQFQAYEAQQPPLYYWALSLPARVIAGWPIEQRVRFLRMLSVLLASFCLPFTWLMSKEILPEKLRLLPVALLAVAPGLAIDISRIANDALLIPATAAFCWLIARRKPAPTATGVALGIALLAKASALPLVPALIVLWWRRARRELITALVLAAAIAAWWYARNLLLGHSVSGWLLDEKSTNVLSGIRRIPWLSAVDIGAKSFTWFGGWSFLTLKSWMYRIPEAIALAAGIAIVFRRPARISAPAVVLAFAALAYSWGILVTFAVQGVPNLNGWYLWPFAPLMALLITGGLGRFAWVLLPVLALLDVYGAGAVMAPYYAGLLPHSRADLSLLPSALLRLAVSRPLALAWLVATLTPIAPALTNTGRR
jgi:hypothetical protein